MPAESLFGAIFVVLVMATFAAALACAAGGPSVLIDLDGVGGGLDVTLGLEGIPGARWSGLQLDGGHLDPVVLDQGLLRFVRGNELR